jgi:hypothetical protein
MWWPWVAKRTKDGRRAYSCYIHGHSLVVKVDSKPLTRAHRNLVLAQKSPIIMPSLSANESPIRKQIRRFVTRRGPLKPHERRR